MKSVRLDVAIVTNTLPVAAPFSACTPDDDTSGLDDATVVNNFHLMNCLNGTVTVHRAYRSWNRPRAVGSFLLFEFSVFVLTLSPFPKQCFDRPRTERNENVQMDNRESGCRAQTENN